jgi:hypothetical protein
MRTFRASRVYPVILIGIVLVLCYLFFAGYDSGRIGRAVAAATFVASIVLQAVLLQVQTELILDETRVSYRKRRWFGGTRLETISCEDIERIRIKGAFVRLKLTDDSVAMLKLTILSRSDRKEALDWFRRLPQYVDNPYGEVRSKANG